MLSLFLLLVFTLLTFAIVHSISFDANGRLEQLEYAQKAVEQGSGIVAARALDGIVMIKIRYRNTGSGFSKPLESGIKRLFNGPYFVGTGLVFDVSYLKEKCFEFCTQHMTMFGKPPPIRKIGNQLSQMIYERTLVNDERPLGASCLLLQPRSSAISNQAESEIIEIDCTGQCHDCMISCIGGCHAKTVLSKWPKDLVPTSLAGQELGRKIIALWKEALPSEADVNIDDMEYEIYHINSDNKLEEIPRSILDA